MSLILQALKKAEAERELGRVPTLASAELHDERPVASRRPGLWILMLLALGVLVTVTVWVMWPAAQVPTVVAPPMPTSPPLAAAPAAPPPPVAVAPIARPVPPPARPAASLPPRPKPAASAPLPTQDQLPAELQRKLPNLAVTGTIWSPVPADRMLMIAGQVLHEGDRITPELELQSIGQREAVLRVQGTSFRLPY
jgi:general secretion pathway protein B